MVDDDTRSMPPRHGYLAAPWRMRYLSRNAERSGCVFCDKLRSEDDVGNLVLWSAERFAIIMNLYPYSTGHVMLVPYLHLASPEEMDDPTLMADMAAAIPATMRALRRVLKCQGFNTGMNTGGAAGAGIADHLHLHIVPRWNGDANFMPVIGKITVMPEELSITYAKLRAELTVEHDDSKPIRALVLSPDNSAVLVKSDTSTLPTTFTDGDRSIVSIMAADLNTMGIEVAPAGWIGEDVVVWQSTTASEPPDSGWVPIPDLADELHALAKEAISRLEHP